MVLSFSVAVATQVSQRRLNFLAGELQQPSTAPFDGVAKLEMVEIAAEPLEISKFKQCLDELRLGRTADGTPIRCHQEGEWRAVCVILEAREHVAGQIVRTQQDDAPRRASHLAGKGTRTAEVAQRQAHVPYSVTYALDAL